jgi:activator of HSP90 ATPase
MANLIEQIVIFRASPHEVYEALMDSVRHADFTNSPAEISREVGGDYMAYGGYIIGQNLELVPDQKIVQSWRAMDWPEEQVSVVTFWLTELPGGGTHLNFSHHDVPDGTEDEFTQGWIENYWEPLKVYLEK